MTSALPDVAVGQSHTQAHNDERHKMNSTERLRKNVVRTRRKMRETVVHPDVSAFAISGTKLAGASLDVIFCTTSSTPTLIQSNYNLVDWGQARGMTTEIYAAGTNGWLSHYEPWSYSQRSMSFWTDSKYVSVCLFYGISNAANVWVDGQRAAANNQVVISYSGFYVNLTFTTNKARLIEIKSDQFAYSISVEPTAQIWRPTAMRGPRVLIVGASLSQGANATGQYGAFQQLDDLLGLPNVAVDGQSGSGYISNGVYYNNETDPLGSGRYTHPFRRLNNVRWNPDVLIVNEVLNDFQMSPQATVAQVEAAMVSQFAYYRAALPNATLVQAKSIISPWFKTIAGGTVPALVAALETDLDNGLLTPYGVKLLAPASGWITGTGYAGHLVGDGNADRYIDTDQAHPNDAGSQYLAGHYADAITDILELP